MAWQDDLQGASWNGVPFFVETADTDLGRLTAQHVYPYREKDPAWVEDLGLGPTTHRIVGFLIGEDWSDKQTAMMAAVQRAGQGQLVHPLLGALTGSIVGGCRFVYRKDDGRYIEFSFTVVENEATAPYPATTSDTKQDATDAASAASAATSGSFSSAVADLKAGVRGAIAATGLPQIASDVAGFGRQVQSAAGDASSLFNGARSALATATSLGRYVSPRGSLPGVTSIAGAIGAVNQARSTVSATVGTMNRLAGLL